MRRGGGQQHEKLLKKSPLGRGGWRSDSGRPRQRSRSQTGWVVASKPPPTPGPDGPCPSQKGIWLPFSFSPHTAHQVVLVTPQKKFPLPAVCKCYSILRVLEAYVLQNLTNLATGSLTS